MKRIVLVFSCIIAALLGLAGCGGSDDSPTKGEFTRQANRICEDGYEQVLAKLQAAQLKSSKSAQENAVSSTVLPEFQKMVDELAELTAPSDNQEEVEAIIEAFEQSVAETEKDPILMLETDAENPYAEPLELSTKFGLESCGGIQ